MEATRETKLSTLSETHRVELWKDIQVTTRIVTIKKKSTIKKR
jgi:hypothetical protein